MRQSVSKIGQLLLLGGAAPAVLVLLLWSGGGGGQTARAYPGLTVGIDLYPNNSDPDLDGVYSSVDVTKFESCYAISGPGNSIDVDVFVLDVADLAAFSADVEYDSSVIDVTGVDTDLLLGSAPGSIVVDVSGPIPPSPPGKYEAGAFDQEQKGVDGSGVLARLTLQGVANGVSSFDLDLNPFLTRGVTLQDINLMPLGDTAGSDGLFDGPFINEETTISVGSAGDPDGDGALAGCDNCPDDPNPLQEDIDGDGLGDACDEDKDGDGFINDEETARGSLDDNWSSTPEVCDDAVTDEDGDGQFNEGYDYLPLPSGNGVPDCTENVDTDGDTTPNFSDSDDDSDGFSDDWENWIATNSLDGCADTPASNNEWDDKWPPDADDNRTANILDILKFKPAFGSRSGDANWRQRYDLDADEKISILDILRLKPYFGTACVP